MFFYGGIRKLFTGSRAMTVSTTNGFKGEIGTVFCVQNTVLSWALFTVHFFHLIFTTLWENSTDEKLISLFFFLQKMVLKFHANYLL